MFKRTVHFPRQLRRDGASEIDRHYGVASFSGQIASGKRAAGRP
jgi:hypothetical protein